MWSTDKIFLLHIAMYSITNVLILQIMEFKQADSQLIKTGLKALQLLYIRQAAQRKL